MWRLAAGGRGTVAEKSSAEVSAGVSAWVRGRLRAAGRWSVPWRRSRAVASPNSVPRRAPQPARGPPEWSSVSGLRLRSASIVPQRLPMRWRSAKISAHRGLLDRGSAGCARSSEHAGAGSLRGCRRAGSRGPRFGDWPPAMRRWLRGRSPGPHPQERAVRRRWPRLLRWLPAPEPSRPPRRTGEQPPPRSPRARGVRPCVAPGACVSPSRGGSSGPSTSHARRQCAVRHA